MHLSEIADPDIAEVMRLASLCHRYDFLVCLWNGLNFFELFIFHFHLGMITTPHALYVHMTYVYSLFLMFQSSHDHMAKRSHYHIMILSFRSTTDLWTHPHSHFLLLPPQSHHPYTPRLCRTTTALFGGGYHPVAKCGHPEDLSCTEEDSSHSRLGTAKVEWVLPSRKSVQPDGLGCREPSPD